MRNEYEKRCRPISQAEREELSRNGYFYTDDYRLIEHIKINRNSYAARFGSKSNGSQECMFKPKQRKETR